ncbi:helix-turn-helix domain-containing protein [Parabacteroides goldsteinii]|uniref:helix-turn-helix domain-containing protein n=1 Tax=Parabacteroides goldsteinii TaxID=328812 RepID=UPI002674108F|nr:helix-turn-helix domain-containing protein [Parabacteroides goldsteinii]
MKETVTATDPRIMRLTAQADDITAMCRQLKEEYHPLLHGKRFITDAMLSELLGVCRRTTQDYRDRGLIPYYRLDGKILYAEDDIETFLQSNYRPQFG